MKNKGVNALWLAYVLLLAVCVLVSTFNCLMLVPTDYKGAAVGSITIGEGPLNPAKVWRLFDLVWLPSVMCGLLMLFKNKTLNVLACIISLLQVLIVAFSAKLIEAVEMIVCAIGDGMISYKLTIVGIFELILCVLAFAATVFLTVTYSKETKKEPKCKETNGEIA